MKDPALHALKALVGQRCGLVLEGTAEATFAGAVGRRMAATRAPGGAEYFTRLLADEAEFNELVTLLTINETYFFREPAHLALLTERLIPRLLGQRGGRLPLRIASVGCSTGEEPYSIAIALLERFGESAGSLVSIIAGDIDQQAVARARKATYSAFSFRGVAPERKRRWFRSSGGDFVLDERVRGLVQFHHLNVLSPRLPAAFDAIDVVFFRNVSIYFDDATRRIIQATLHDHLAEDGFLIVGAAETLANDVGIFSLIEQDGCFLFAKTAAPCRAAPAAAKAVAPPPRVMPPPPPRPAVAPSAPPPDLTLDEVRALLGDKHYAEAAAALIRLRAADPDDIRPLLLDAWLHLQQRDLIQAEALAEAALRHDCWSTEARLLLGFVARRKGDLAVALHSFKQAAYARHDCWPVHYYLGDTLRGIGQAEPARRAYRIALQQLSARPDPDGGLLLPLGLPLADVRVLCERHRDCGPAAAGR